MRPIRRSLPILALTLAGCRAPLESDPSVDTGSDSTLTSSADPGTSTDAPTGTDTGMSGPPDVSADPLPCHSHDLWFNSACDVVRPEPAEPPQKGEDPPPTLTGLTFKNHEICWARFPSFEAAQSFVESRPDLEYEQACDLVVPTSFEEAACSDPTSPADAIRAQLGVPTSFPEPRGSWLPLVVIDGIDVGPTKLPECEAAVAKASLEAAQSGADWSERARHAEMICATFKAILPVEAHADINIEFKNALTQTSSDGKPFGTILDLIAVAPTDATKEVVTIFTVAWVRSGIGISREEQIFADNWPSSPGLTFASDGNPAMLVCEDNTRPACPASLGDVSAAETAYRDDFVPVSGANRCDGSVLQRAGGAPYTAPFAICFETLEEQCTCRFGNSVAAPAAAAVWLLYRKYMGDKLEHGPPYRQADLDPVLIRSQDVSSVSKAFNACLPGLPPEQCARCPDPPGEPGEDELADALAGFLANSGVYLDGCGATPMVDRTGEEIAECDSALNDLWSRPTAPRATCNNCLCFYADGKLECLLDPEEAEEAEEGRDATIVPTLPLGMPSKTLELMILHAGKMRTFAVGQPTALPLHIAVSAEIDEIDAVVLRFRDRETIHDEPLKILRGPLPAGEPAKETKFCLIREMKATTIKPYFRDIMRFMSPQSHGLSNVMAVGGSLSEVMSKGMQLDVDPVELGTALIGAERAVLLRDDTGGFMLIQHADCADLSLRDGVQCFDRPEEVPNG